MGKKIVLRLDEQTTALFDITHNGFTEGMMSQEKLARMCFDQGLNQISKTVLNTMIDKTTNGKKKPKTDHQRWHQEFCPTCYELTEHKDGKCRKCGGDGR